MSLTQAELSQLAGVGPVFIHHLEKGKPTLRLDKLLDVLHVLGLGLVLEPTKTALQVSPQLAPPNASDGS